MPTINGVDYTEDEVAAAIAIDPELADMLATAAKAWGTFTPRPDRPELFDQQSSFIADRCAVAWLIKGNASGGTEAAARKTAQFLLYQQQAPRKNTPFWILSNTYEQTIRACWSEKLEANGHIPRSSVDWDRITWDSLKQGMPRSVPLKPWPRDRGGDPDRNWVLVFKSYDQGMQALQAQSIGGFWMSEQPTEAIFREVFRGCRDYLFPGGQFVEFTPTDPGNWAWIERLRDRPPKGWRFYRCNTALNTALQDGWLEQFKTTIPDELMNARLTGASPVFEGAIYQTFNPAIHVVPLSRFAFPSGVWHYRGVDWGASVEHPFYCCWAYRDGLGCWWVYDEYWSPEQGKTLRDHAVEVRERWRWPQSDPHYGLTYADPSRPDGITTFNREGVPCAPANNNVYRGIDTVRTLLKVNPATNQPRLYIARERCPVLAEQLARYRWMLRPPTRAGSTMTGVAPPKPFKKDDDAADGCRYVLHSVESSFGATPISSTHRMRRDPLQLDSDRWSMEGEVDALDADAIEQREWNRSDGWFKR